MQELRPSVQCTLHHSGRFLWQLRLPHNEALAESKLTERGKMPQSVILGILFVILPFVFGRSAQAQDQPSLGDVARQASATKSSHAGKPPKIITNDDVNSGTDRHTAGGTRELSPEDQAWCAQVKSQNSPGEADPCVLLRIDMGAEYEDIVSLLVGVRKQICARSNARQPNNSALFAEEKRLDDRFSELRTEQIQAGKDAQSDYEQSQERENEEAVELYRKRGRMLHSTKELATSEFQDARDLSAKYDQLFKQKEAIIEQEKVRTLRVLTDQLRFQQTCPGA